MKIVLYVLLIASVVPVYSAEGLKIAYTSQRDPDVDLEELYLMNPDGSEKTRLTADSGNEFWPTWSPDGRYLYYWANYHRRSTNSFMGDVFRMSLASGIIQQITSGQGDWNAPSLSPQGDLLAVIFCSFDAGLPGRLFTVDVVSGLATSILESETENWPDWSPDGQRLAFSSRRDGAWHIYVFNLKARELQQVTDGPGEFRPRWSPDGERIVFASVSLNGAGDLFIVNADGTGLTQLTDTPQQESDPSWSPDGTMIAFSGQPDGGSVFDRDIFVINADGSARRRLTWDPGADRFPAWSPVPIAGPIASAVETDSWGAIKLESSGR